MSNQRVNSAMQNRSASGDTGQPNKRLKRGRTFMPGTRYRVQTVNSVLLKDGSQLTPQEAYDVLTTWCSDRTKDPDFSERIRTNQDKLIEEFRLEDNPSQYLCQDDLVKETNDHFTNWFYARALEVLPMIPDTFHWNGNTYTMERTTRTKTAEAWIMPESDDTPTIEYAQADLDKSPAYYYKDELVEDLVEELMAELGPKLVIVDDDTYTVVSETFEKPILSVIRRTLQNGQVRRPKKRWSICGNESDTQ